MVAVARTPHDEAGAAHYEGQEEALEAVLGLEVAASALRDGGDEPVADGAAVEAAHEGANQVGDVDVAVGEFAEVVQGRQVGRVGGLLKDDPAEGDALAECARHHGWVEEEGQQAPEVVEEARICGFMG